MPWNAGLAAAFGAVLFGAFAVIQTRRLKGEHTVLLMLFYTLGLTVLTAVPAAFVWVTPHPRTTCRRCSSSACSGAGRPVLLPARLPDLAEIRILAPLGYLWIVLSMAMDYAAFGLVPTPLAVLGAAIIMASALAGQILDRRRA